MSPPFKGLCLGRFFITVGAGIDFDAFFAPPSPIASRWRWADREQGIRDLGLVLGTRVQDQGPGSGLFTLSLAQAGEFGFVLVSFSVNTNCAADWPSQTRCW